MDRRELGAGDVEILLVDEHGVEKTLVLKPSLHAMRTLSRRYAGLAPIIDRLAKLDFEVIVDVIEAGLQMPANPKSRSELERSVYATGLSDLTGGIPTLAVRFVTILMHGGRVPPDELARGEGQDIPPAPSKIAS